MQSQNEHVDLMKGLIKRGEILNKQLVISLGFIDKIKNKILEKMTNDSSDNKELFLTNLIQKFNCMSQILSKMKNNLCEKSQCIQTKKEELRSLQNIFELRSDIYIKTIYKCLEKRNEIMLSKNNGMSSLQNNILHEMSAYDIVCEDIEKDLITQLENCTLLENNLKHICNEKINKKYGISIENFKSFTETKTDLMHQEIGNILSKITQQLQEITTDEDQNLIELSQKLILLESKITNIDEDIKNTNLELFKLDEKKKALNNMKIKFKKFLEIDNLNNDKILSLEKGNFLADLSFDTCCNQSVSYGMIYLSMFEDLKKI